MLLGNELHHIKSSPMMPRYGMDKVGTCHWHGKDTDFPHKKRSSGYDTTRYVAHSEVSLHHSINNQNH